MITLRSIWRAFCVCGLLAAAATVSAADQPSVGGGDETHDSARTWAMQNIAVIQALDGDIQGAKRTAAQIGRPDDPGPIEVTGVRFLCGRPVYDRPPCLAPAHCRRVAIQQAAALGVSTKTPPGLPADYLAADPIHGQVVGFIDEFDSRGTRVTTRTFADGYVAIETPRRGSAAGR